MRGDDRPLPPMPPLDVEAGLADILTGTCDATETPGSVWRGTKPAGHTGDRHVSEIPALGTYCWGYVPEVDDVPPNAGSAT